MEEVFGIFRLTFHAHSDTYIHFNDEVGQLSCAFWIHKYGGRFNIPATHASVRYYDLQNMFNYRCKNCLQKQHNHVPVYNMFGVQVC